MCVCGGGGGYSNPQEKRFKKNQQQQKNPPPPKKKKKKKKKNPNFQRQNGKVLTFKMTSKKQEEDWGVGVAQAQTPHPWLCHSATTVG